MKIVFSFDDGRIDFIDSSRILSKYGLVGTFHITTGFVDGSFVGTDLASLHTVDKIRLSYNKPILMQCDGETAMLSPAHFPLIMELTDPCLRVLQPVNL